MKNSCVPTFMLTLNLCLDSTVSGYMDSSSSQWENCHEKGLLT